MEEVMENPSLSTRPMACLIDLESMNSSYAALHPSEIDCFKSSQFCLRSSSLNGPSSIQRVATLHRCINGQSSEVELARGADAMVEN